MGIYCYVVLCRVSTQLQSSDLAAQKNINMYMYSAFNVYRRELAPGTVSLTGDRAQGDDSKHWANSSIA